MSADTTINPRIEDKTVMNVEGPLLCFHLFLKLVHDELFHLQNKCLQFLNILEI